MKLLLNRHFFTLLLFFFSLININCGEDSNAISVTVSKKDKNENPPPYIPKRSTPEKKKIDFKIVESENPIQVDRNYIRNWFQQLQKSDEFIQEIDIDSTSNLSYDFLENLHNDLNGDGLKDVIILVKKNIQDKKSFSRMYVFAFNNGRELIPVEYFFGGSYESELLFEFRQITDSGTVLGELVPNHFVKNKDKFRIEYYFDGKEFIHK